MELQINEVKEIDGVKVKCVEDKLDQSSCANCILEGKNECAYMECRYKRRTDKKGVYFILAE